MPTFKGSYDESMTAAIAAFRAGNAPHILQVFEVGTATMMASKGAIVPVGKVMTGRRPEVRPEGLRARGGRLLHRAERPDAELPVQQLDDGLPLQQGRLQGRRPRPGEAADDLARGGAGRRQAEGQRPQVPVHHQLEQLDAARELLGLAQRRVRDQEQRLRRHSTRGWRSTRRCTCATSRTWPTWPSRACSSTRAAATRPTRPSSRANARWSTGSSALYGNIKRNAKFASGIVDPALLPRRARRAAEHRDRRRQPVGDVRQEARGVQGRGRVLQLPVAARGRGRRATSAPATCRSRRPSFELTEKSGFYKQNPGTDVAGDADDPQDHRQVARHPARQLRADPHHRRRGAGAGLERQEDAPRKALDSAVKRGNEQLERFEKANKS